MSHHILFLYVYLCNRLNKYRNFQPLAAHYYKELDIQYISEVYAFEKAASHKQLGVIEWAKSCVKRKHFKRPES